MPGQFDLVVARNDLLTPHMRRVVVAGDALAEFPADQASGYVKVAFAEDGQQVLRSYTIRAFDPDQRMLTLDFVDHGDTGPASRWARRVQVGESVTLFGPGEKKLVDPAADWYLLGGDLAALPALSANLELMRQDAVGYAVIEVPEPADQQPLQAPPGVQLVWVEGDHAEPNQALVNTIRQLPWLDGRCYPWFAGEFDGMRAMRRYLRDERSVDRRQMYLSCYWKQGDTDEGMKRAKRADAEQDALLQTP